MFRFNRFKPARAACLAAAVGIALALMAAARSAHAGSSILGTIQGRVVATDTGDPLGFADVQLIPVDTTLRKVGALTNADGTYRIEAPAGRYTLQVRAMSYARKRLEGVVILADRIQTYDTGLWPEAIQQEEIVVEARARQNTENSMLAARKKAAALGDAVSAEQVRRSSDKDAAEVLKRVTGTTVSDGKYVYVRGLGERYSSTEVDGVRIASPEQNKRVVPLDLVPSSLLENIVVQKTYTADRPGEFGGGDVQVRTRDFPGSRTLSFSVTQGYAEGVTFQDRRSYQSTSADVFGFGANARRIPDAVYEIAGDSKLNWSENNPANGFPRATLAEIGKSFENVWSPTRERDIPNGTYTATYGDEFKPFGRSLGIIQSWSFSRSFDIQDETERFYTNPVDWTTDYAVNRSTETAQLGGIGGLSYRISARSTIHLRGLYTNSADDEVRVYEGADRNRDEPVTGTPLHHRGVRLMYVQRNVLSGTLEGRHQLPWMLDSGLDWKLTRSRAQRLQPDRREVIYDRYFLPDANGNLIESWQLGSAGGREYGDLRDNGWGTTVNSSVPYKLGGLGSGKVVLGLDRQVKHRDNFYRRFLFHQNANADITASPDEIFDPASFDGSYNSAWIEENTYNDANFTDNYRAHQKTDAAYMSADVPFGRQVRGSFGIRVEHGVQDVQSFDLFNPANILHEGKLDDVDWLPSANLTVSMSQAVNLRLAASRTLSRPDLNELSPSPSLEYVGGFQVSGNPHLQRSTIENYDIRVEAFPSLAEVFAAGFFYKRMQQPIEQVFQAGAPPVLVPRNSDHLQNLGVELEARSGLGRAWKRLSAFSVNTNASFVSSEVTLQQQISKFGSAQHPLQGQADYTFNAALTWAKPNGRMDMSVLVSSTGRRLHALGVAEMPDIYAQPVSSLDVSMNVVPFPRTRLKFGARNLLGRRIQLTQGENEVKEYRSGRSYSIALSCGS